jgi:hypothetical protein
MAVHPLGHGTIRRVYNCQVRYGVSSTEQHTHIFGDQRLAKVSGEFMDADTQIS